MPPTTTIESRTASLADGEETIIEGTAIGVDDVTRGIDPDSEDNKDILKLWPADALEAGAASLAGRAINPLHSSQSVGEVIAAWFEAGEGVKYRARIDDEALAGHVDAHTVSIEARHFTDGRVETPRGHAVRVADPTFTGLAIVQNGAAPSATAQTVAAAEGTRPDTAVCAAVREAFGADHGEEDDEDDEADEMAAEGATIPDEYRFDNPGEAVEKAQDMGFGEERDLAGDELVHTHGDGEDTVFMPGPSHEALVEMLDDEGILGGASLLDADVPYEVTNVAPGDVDAWTDAEWDGGAVEASLPNPSEDEGAADVLDQTMALNPADDEARDAKATWGAPFRDGADAPVNTRALVAIDGALSGARGGFEGLGEETASSLAEWTQSMLAAAPDDLFGSADEADAAEHDMMQAPAADDIVTWNSQGDRPAAGRVIETIDEGRYDTELSGDATVTAPAALIRLYRPSGDGEWGKTDVTVAHRTDTDTLEVRDGWPEISRMAVAHLVDINGTTIDLTPPDYVVSAAAAALDAKDQYDALADCGTGVGEARAEAITTNDLAPADFTGGENTAIPDYLNSHSDDVSGIDSHPREWGEETWTDGCGPVQYALWGGTADGRALEWFDETEAELEAAMGDDAAAAEPDTAAETQAATEQDDDEPAESGAESGAANAPQTTPQSMSDPDTDPTDPDEPSVDELRARLSEKDDRIDDLEAEVETLAEKVDATEAAAEEYAAALVDAGETVLSEADLIERFDVAELAEMYDETETATLATPDEDPDPDVRSGADPEGGDTATLSAAEKEERDEIKTRLAELEDRDGPLAAAEQDRLESELEELEA